MARPRIRRPLLALLVLVAALLIGYLVRAGHDGDQGSDHGRPVPAPVITSARS